jgi:hypothetical protein
VAAGAELPPLVSRRLCDGALYSLAEIEDDK